jgi:hypothetical protein
MTPEEIAWSEEVRCRALKLVTKCLRIKQETAEGSAAHRIAQDAGLLALALAGDAATRIGQDRLAADQQAVVGAGYDLAALATAAPSSIEE